MAGDADTAAGGELSKTAETATSADELEVKSHGEHAAEASEVEANAKEDVDVDSTDGADDRREGAASFKQRMSPTRLGAAVVSAVMIVLAGLAGWLEFQSHQAQQEHQRDDLFVRVARQGATNLATIDWQHADSDLQRILDTSTGTFYDDLNNRRQPFLDSIKKVQSKSQGTVSEAALESVSGDQAKVLVTMAVNISNSGAAQQEPRDWRIRIDVQKVGDDEAKMSNVAFVP